MKTLFYITAFILIAISVFFNVSAYAGGAGGSWGEDSGFGGNGGFGGGGAGGSWGGQCTDAGWTRSATINGQYFATAEAACRAIASIRKQTYLRVEINGNSARCFMQGDQWSIFKDGNCEPPPEPECPVNMHWDGSNCVKDLKCPAGYKKDGDNCIWQCPAGTKMVGGNCVKDDQPEDCDPIAQECDENGEPVCEPCSKLQQLVNNNQTMINNDNRIISLNETIVSNQNTTNNNINNVNTSINNVNNNISNVNNNLTTINESIENVITTIENNKPDFDTTAIENKLDEVVNAIQNNNGVGEDGQPIDLTEIIRLLNEIDLGVKDSKFDDTQLNAYFDEILQKGIPVGVDFTEVTDRQDDQTGLLKDIKKLLMPTNEAGDPDLGIPEVGEFDAHLDPWSAIRGFDINQNMINAQAQCPSGEAYSFTVMGKTFDMPMTIMCNFLGQIGVGIMFLAYMSGAFIIVKGD